LNVLHLTGGPIMHDREKADTEQRLLARIDALASRLDEQAAIIAEQRATLAEQSARLAQLAGSQSSAAGSASTATTGARTSRRGLVTRLFGAAAAAALLAVAKEPPSAYAFARGTILGSGGSTPNYGFVAAGGTADPAAALPGLRSLMFGLIGTASAAAPAPTFSSGVAGFGSTHGGVMGLSVSNVGVYGESNSHTGVYGLSQSNAGVYGQSGSGAGLYGVSAVTGVVGVGANNAGVQGSSTSGTGVYGESSSGTALYGTSPNNGLFAVASNIGVWGLTSTGTAVLGQAMAANGFAGHFVGNVYIQGNLTVAGAFPKSAAVPHPDGSLRRMYCQEAPEAYFEDFGRVKLVNGQATVYLDPDFAAVIDADNYLVFLTEQGDSGGLFLTSQTPTAFTVQARVPNPGEVWFVFRVVARRRDLPDARMERVQELAVPTNRPTPRVLDPNTRLHPTVVSGPDVPR
jgi:hypothetical protein